jgi:hypothetical protein
VELLFNVVASMASTRCSVASRRFRDGVRSTQHKLTTYILKQHKIEKKAKAKDKKDKDGKKDKKKKDKDGDDDKKKKEKKVPYSAS